MSTHAVIILYDASTAFGPAQPVPELIDWAFADEGSVSSDPGNGVLFFVHPDSHARANLTVYRSKDDSRSWGDLVTVWPGSAAYSDSVVLDPKSAQGAGRHVGVLFERNNNGEAAGILFAVVGYAS